MYKRNIKPIIDFMNTRPTSGIWLVDCGYGKLYYFNKDVACTISARTDRNGSTILIEIDDEPENTTSHS